MLPASTDWAYPPNCTLPLNATLPPPAVTAASFNSIVSASNRSPPPTLTALPSEIRSPVPPWPSMAKDPANVGASETSEVVSLPSPPLTVTAPPAPGLAKSVSSKVPFRLRSRVRLPPRSSTAAKSEVPGRFKIRWVAVLPVMSAASSPVQVTSGVPSPFRSMLPELGPVKFLTTVAKDPFRMTSRSPGPVV